MSGQDGHDPGGRTAEDVAELFTSTVYEGNCGRIVLTVHAAAPESTRMLARICGAAVEGAVFRAYRERLRRC